jgi:cytidylate kinase
VVVAIDGPSGVGKSTVSRAVAMALGIPHLDTGSYYRAATFVALQAGVQPSDEAAVLAALSDSTIDVVDGVMTIGGFPRGEELRSPEVTAAVSTVAAHPRVRSEVVDMQRRWVADHGGDAVVEGRDIGTVVFTDAAVKVFLTANAATRASRRARDQEAQGTSVADLQADLERRDRADSTREASPLRPADDAITIDTSSLTIQQVVGQVLDLVGAI